MHVGSMYILNLEDLNLDVYGFSGCKAELSVGKLTDESELLETEYRAKAQVVR